MRAPRTCACHSASRTVISRPRGRTLLHIRLYILLHARRPCRALEDRRAGRRKIQEHDGASVCGARALHGVGPGRMARSRSTGTMTGPRRRGARAARTVARDEQGCFARADQLTIGSLQLQFVWESARAANVPITRATSLSRICFTQYMYVFGSQG